MITIGLTKDYAAIASDSARNDAEKGVVFGSPKITLIDSRYIFSYLGTNLYFQNIDTSRFTPSFNETVLYLQNHFTEMRPKVRTVLKESGEKNNHPFSMAMIGIHMERPTVVVFSEDVGEFVPLYTWTETEEPKFLWLSSEKKKQPKSWPEIKGKFELVPGLMGEILTKKIYQESDRLEEKTSGGVVTVAFMDKKGPFSLSNWEVIINGSRKPAVSEHRV